MRLRSFAREIAFLVLYRDDLNPESAPATDDAATDLHRTSREVADFVRRLIDEEDQDETRDAEPVVDAELLRQWIQSAPLVDFTGSLVTGVRRRRHSLDQQIAQAAENWSLDRMAPTDRNLLRLGGYELLYTDVPGKVAVDEAVELAKRFGSAQSAQFVNGILDRLMHQKQGDQPDGSV